MRQGTPWPKRAVALRSAPGKPAAWPPSPPRTGAKSGEYVTQVTAIGPLGLEYLDPEDDPRNSLRMIDRRQPNVGVKSLAVPVMNHIPAIKRILPTLIMPVVFAGTLGITAACENYSATTAKPAATAAAAEMKTLLNEGDGDTAKGYFEAASSTLVAVAAGDYNSKFYDLGELLVKDGLGNTIIEPGREMNGTWYEWSQHRAPPSEPDAYILAWRQIVRTMRSVPGQHFKFLWTVYMTNTSVAESWPGSAYVDYIGTDIFDWYGGPDFTYPHTALGALDHETKWQQILTAEPGGLDWMAAFSRATGKPVIIPEWGLDFHTFGGQDDTLFITNMMAWMKAHHAIGLYWVQGHLRLRPDAATTGPVLANQGASAQSNSPGAVGALGDLMGGRLQYAGVYLPDRQWPSDSTDQPMLAPWEHAGYQLILSVPMVPNPPAIKSYSGPPEPGNEPYQLTDYPDAIAALRQGA
jgi:Glycosyl hydrolase family 26